MRLRYLETENFLSHKSESVAFPSAGIFLLAGESGAGKSSFIVDAVAFALYGVVATRARRGADLRNHSRSEDDLQVRATFDLDDGRRLTIARGIDSRGSSWAQLYAPDPDDPSQSKLLAEGASPVGQAIRRELGGMTWQQFHAAFVARQSEIAMLTNLRGSERKLLVQRMLGMRELDKAGEMLTDRLRRTNAEREQLERGIGEFDLVAEQASLAEDQAKAARSRQRIDSLKAQEAQARERERELGEEIAPLRAARDQQEAEEAKRRERTDLEKSIPGLRTAVELHREAEEALGALPAAKGALVEAESERDRLREIFRASREQAVVREKIATLQGELQEVQAGLEPPPGGSAIATRTGLQEARGLAGVASSSLALHEKALGEKRAQIERLEGSGECYVCQRSFESEHDHDQVLATMSAETGDLEEQIAKDKATLDWFSEAEPLLEQGDRITVQISRLEERLVELDEAGAQDDLDGILLLGEEANRRVGELQKAQASAEALRRNLDPESAERLLRAEKRLGEIDGDAKLPEVSLERLAELEKELAATGRSLAELSGKRPEAERALAEVEKNLEEKSRALKGREGELENLTRLRNRVSALERLQTYLKAYGKHLSHEIRPALEEIGSEMIRRVSAGRHVAMHIDDDYEIELEEASGQRLRASMLSGGESIRANICLRLALTRLVTQRTGVPVGFLIFDEPLPSQDPGHIERIMELLDSLRPFYPQQFVISHVGDLRSRDEVDYLLEFGDGPLGLVQA